MDIKKQLQSAIKSPNAVQGTSTTCTFVTVLGSNRCNLLCHFAKNKKQKVHSELAFQFSSFPAKAAHLESFQCLKTSISGAEPDGVFRHKTHGDFSPCLHSASRTALLGKVKLSAPCLDGKTQCRRRTLSLGQGAERREGGNRGAQPQHTGCGSREEDRSLPAGRCPKATPNATDTCGLAHARRNLSQRPGPGSSPRTERPAPARRLAHARRRLGPWLGRSSRPLGPSAVTAVRSSGSGGGERWPAAGVPDSGPLHFCAPPRPPTPPLHPSYLGAGPSRVRSAFRVAVTARSGARHRGELAPPPEAARPRRDALRCPAGRGRKGSADEGRGLATAPRPSSPSSAAPCRPRPFPADAPSPRSGPLGLTPRPPPGPPRPGKSPVPQMLGI
nr:uncharacterized protein LOC105855970 [Microcebus murinus]